MTYLEHQVTMLAIYLVIVVSFVVAVRIGKALEHRGERRRTTIDLTLLEGGAMLDDSVRADIIDLRPKPTPHR